jgi:hypothetical protein
MSESLLVYHHLTNASCRAPGYRTIEAIPPTKWQYMLALAVDMAVASVSCDYSAGTLITKITHRRGHVPSRYVLVRIVVRNKRWADAASSCA